MSIQLTPPLPSADMSDRANANAALQHCPTSHACSVSNDCPSITANMTDSVHTNHTDANEGVGITAASPTPAGCSSSSASSREQTTPSTTRSLLHYHTNDNLLKIDTGDRYSTVAAIKRYIAKSLNLSSTHNMSHRKTSSKEVCDDVVARTPDELTDPPTQDNDTPNNDSSNTNSSNNNSDNTKTPLLEGLKRINKNPRNPYLFLAFETAQQRAAAVALLQTIHYRHRAWAEVPVSDRDRMLTHKGGKRAHSSTETTSRARARTEGFNDTNAKDISNSTNVQQTSHDDDSARAETSVHLCTASADSCVPEMRNEQSAHNSPACAAPPAAATVVSKLTQYAHLPMPEQLSRKSQHCLRVMKALLPPRQYGPTAYVDRFHGLTPSPVLVGYRNHIQLTFGYNEAGCATLGFNKGSVLEGTVAIESAVCEGDNVSSSSSSSSSSVLTMHPIASVVAQVMMNVCRAYLPDAGETRCVRSEAYANSSCDKDYVTEKQTDRVNGTSDTMTDMCMTAMERTNVSASVVSSPHSAHHDKNKNNENDNDEDTTHNKEEEPPLILRVLDRVSGAGFWRRVQIRHNIRGAVMVDVEINPTGVTEAQRRRVCDHMLRALLSPRTSSQIAAAALTAPLPSSPSRCVNRVVSVHYHTHAGIGSTVCDSPRVWLGGSDATLTEELCGLRFELSPMSFFQVNTGGMERMMQEVRRWAGLTRRTVLLDLCSGTGTIGLALASSVSRVIGIELVESAVRNARRNAEMNGIANAVFHCGAVERVLPAVMANLRTTMMDSACSGRTDAKGTAAVRVSMIGAEEAHSEEGKHTATNNNNNNSNNTNGNGNDMEDVKGVDSKPVKCGNEEDGGDWSSSCVGDACHEANEETVFTTTTSHGASARVGEDDIVAIVDPPRAGVHATVLKWIRGTSAIRRVIYISCEQRALERDCPHLMKPSTKAYRGLPFEVTASFAVDLFPHTPHVEMVMVLTRKTDTT